MMEYLIEEEYHSLNGEDLSDILIFITESYCVKLQLELYLKVAYPFIRMQLQ